jgi:choline dehydrogenase-like flavoprotein
VILDLRELADQSHLRADLCIIGGGPAGIALARRFTAGPRQVLVLESGGLELEADAQELNRGEVRGERYFDLRLPRQRVFGGTSVHWTGEMGVLGEVDFAARPWQAYPGWPIAREEVASRYAEALEICGGSAWPRNPAGDPALFRRDPMPPGGAHRLELRYRQRRAAGPRRFGTHYRDELAASRSVRVVLHANATELVAEPGGGHVRELVVRTLGGRRATVAARAFVLACGGLENPRLLLLSNRVEPRGLGNRHDQVGRCFQEHPVVEVAQVFGFAESLARVAGPIAGSPVLLPDLCPSAELVTRERLQQFGIELAPAGEPVWDLDRRQRDGTRRFVADAARLLPWLTNEIDESGSRRPGGLPAMKRARLDSMQEMAPDPACRVTLGEERDALGCRRLVLDLRLGAEFRRTLAAAARALVHELGRFSIGRVAPSAWTAPGFDGEIPWRGAAHHLGTTRMSDDPARGVVDRDCRVHGVDNLWIAGSSVFPASGYVNPTLTIVALALRLAEHLEARLP